MKDDPRLRLMISESLTFTLVRSEYQPKETKGWDS